ncbi:hypothetical protein AMTRI_Chr01g132670 [Amborella trichopoda]
MWNLHVASLACCHVPRSTNKCGHTCCTIGILARAKNYKYLLKFPTYSKNYKYLLKSPTYAKNYKYLLKSPTKYLSKIHACITGILARAGILAHAPTKYLSKIHACITGILARAGILAHAPCK